jgi:ribosomal protein L29
VDQQKENIDADRARGLVGQLTSKIQKEEDEDLRSQMKELKIELLKIFNPRGAAELEAKPQKKERIRQFRADYDNAIGRGISHEGAKEYARQMSLDRTVSAART